MELRNEFVVRVPVDKAWALLTDLEQIAPCMPGAQLTEVQGENYLGLVKVKVGPITMSYRGTASFVERDENTHKAVLRAEGRDTRGQGNAQALVTAQLTADGEQTHVTVVTDLAITGKIAQFGRGALADVSGKLLGQFVETLEASLLGERPEVEQPAAAGSANPARSAARTIAAPAAEPAPVDLLATVGVPRAVRWAVPAVVGLVLLVVLRSRRARASRR